MGEIKKLSLLTFNTLGVPFSAPGILKRDNKIAELINSSSYDVICLQEIFTYIQFAVFKKKLNAFPYYVIQKNPLGPGGGLAIFSKYPLTDKMFYTYSYPDGIDIPFSTRLARPGILSAICRKYGVRIATTHLSSDNEHDLSPENKIYDLIAGQSGEAAKAFNRYTKETVPLIVTGDFNINRGSDLYNRFLKQTKLTDLYAKAKKPVYDQDRLKFFYRAPADRCDYIFTDRESKKFKTDTLSYAFEGLEALSNGRKSYLSDHIGLHCILEVNK